MCNLFIILYVTFVILIRGESCKISSSATIHNFDATRLQLSIYDGDFKGPSPLWYTPEMQLHSINLIQSFDDVVRKNNPHYKALISNWSGVSNVNSEDEILTATQNLFLREDLLVVSHGVQKGDSWPILNYGNSAALKRWGTSWEELTSMPSIKTAELQSRKSRKKMLDKVSSDGYIDNYEAIG